MQGLRLYPSHLLGPLTYRNHKIVLPTVFGQQNARLNPLIVILCIDYLGLVMGAVGVLLRRASTSMYQV